MAIKFPYLTSKVASLLGSCLFWQPARLPLDLCTFNCIWISVMMVANKVLSPLRTLTYPPSTDNHNTALYRWLYQYISILTKTDNTPLGNITTSRRSVIDDSSFQWQFSRTFFSSPYSVKTTLLPHTPNDLFDHIWRKSVSFGSLVQKFSTPTLQPPEI